MLKDDDIPQRPGRVVPLEEAAGMRLGHDITEVCRGGYKGRAFRRGHKLRPEDFGKLRDLGKDSIYALSVAGDEVHEDDAALALAAALAGEGIAPRGGPSEGRIDLIARRDGLLKVDRRALLSFNMLGEVACATLHDNTLVERGQTVAGTRAIPLVIKKSVVDEAVRVAEAARSSGRPVIEVREIRKPAAGIVITGNEVYYGRKEDSFLPVVEGKLRAFGGRIVGAHFAPDDAGHIEKRLRELVEAGADLLVVTGGMSVDPDDVTRFAVRRLGAVDIVYGSPVLPGSMILVGFLEAGGIPVVGCAFGLAAGVPPMLASCVAGRCGDAAPLAGSVWVLFVFALWGAALGWAFLRTGAEAPDEAVVSGDWSARRIDRRRFLIRMAGAAAVFTVGGAVVGSLTGRRGRPMPEKGGRWSATNPLPNADVEVKPAPGTRPEFTSLEEHYRIDINTASPVIDGAAWRLEVGGLVGRPLALTLEDLRRYEPTHLILTLACISNPVGGDLIGTTRWTGVSLKRLVPELGLKPGATHLKVTSADGFWEVVPLADVMADERIMLCYDWDGVPLMTNHGYPLRIYIPDHYGMKQPKWIESIEATDRWEPGYWVKRGWDREARMKATSVIDTIALDDAFTGPGGESLVPVGGIAHAGARGISKVELRVDDGPWREARLRAPMSGLTWVVWRYDLPFMPGKHKLTVRCREADGTPQTETPAPPEPAGATGLDERTVKFLS